MLIILVFHNNTMYEYTHKNGTKCLMDKRPKMRQKASRGKKPNETKCLKMLAKCLNNTTKCLKLQQNI